MGVVTLLNFRTEIISAMSGRVTETADVAKMNRWVNAGYLEVTGAIDFAELDAVFNIATVDGTVEYDGPTDAAGWRSVFDETNDLLLERVSLEQLYRRERSIKNIPDFWSRRGDTLILSPTPNAVINERLLYKKNAAILDDDADLTAISGTWDHAIYLLAMSSAHLSFSEENRATFWRNLAVAYIQSRFTEGDLISGRFVAPAPAQGQ